LASNTKVIADVMEPVSARGAFHEGAGDGKAGRAAESEMVVRMHRMMGPEKEPEASCDVEMTLQ